MEKKRSFLFHMEKKRKVYSAFILHEDQTWEQPSFSVPAEAKGDDIEKAILAKYGGFYVTGLQVDNDAPEDKVRLLDVTPNKAGGRGYYELYMKWLPFRR